MKVLVRRKTAPVAAAGATGTEPRKTGGNDSAIASLDDLRLTLITDLSHQLRTPLTAMRLALDGLLSELGGELDGPRAEFADITRRNLDRLVRIVDRQLDLLGMALGELIVERRPVVIADVVEHVGALLAQTGATVDVFLEDDDEVTAFTDPDHLVSLLMGLLCEGPPGADRRLVVRSTPEACTIEIVVDYLGGNASGPARRDTGGDGLDFERRACDAMVTALGGCLEMSKDANAKQVSITLPAHAGSGTDH